MVCLQLRLGIPLQVPWGTRGDSRVALEIQVPIRFARASQGVLWSHGRGIRPHFLLTGEFPCVFLVAARGMGSPELPRGPEGASHVVSGKSGIRSSCEGLLGIPLELVQGTRASFQVEVGNSVFLSSSERDSGILWRLHWRVRRCLVLGHGTPLPSRGGKGVSGLLWS